MKKRQVIERPTDEGEVIKDGKVIAKARYALVITQEMVSDGRGGSIPGIKDVTGTIAILEGEWNLNDGSSLKLKMADGRIWPFFAQPGNPVPKVFNCVGMGDFET